MLLFRDVLPGFALLLAALSLARSGVAGRSAPGLGCKDADLSRPGRTGEKADWRDSDRSTRRLSLDWRETGRDGWWLSLDWRETERVCWWPSLDWRETERVHWWLSADGADTGGGREGELSCCAK